MARQVQERTLQLQRSNEDLLQFAHVITHDLKEPVRKTKIYNNRILDEYSADLADPAKDYLTRIKNATERMSSMIDGVLSYSSVRTSEERNEQVDLNEIFDNIENDLELIMQQKNAIISRPALPAVQGAPVLLYQLFYNVINNSLKFTRPGVPPRIDLTSDTCH